jgi:hypothetical protein
MNGTARTSFDERSLHQLATETEADSGATRHSLEAAFRLLREPSPKRHGMEQQGSWVKPCWTT